MLQCRNKYLLFLSLIQISTSKIMDEEKAEFCNELECDSNDTKTVCGFRFEGDQVKLKLFQNECDLLKYGCSVNEDEAYGTVRTQICQESESGNILNPSFSDQANDVKEINIKVCPEIDCSYPGDDVEVCAIREFEVGYKVRLFHNKCSMFKYNCEQNVSFTSTDLFICDGMDKTVDESDDEVQQFKKMNSLIIVNSSMLIPGQNINETIDTFFAATHLVDLPVIEVDTDLGKEDVGRRSFRKSMPIKVVRPLKTFTPWIRRPEETKTDDMHVPLINTCYHTCPTKCPDIYAPVCGNRGVDTLEPSLMFRNHCFMDAAQCKMFWDNKSYTARTSFYLETTFLFCLGDVYGTYTRFLPVLKTLQRMGRLKKNLKYPMRIRSLRNFYQLLNHDFNVRG